MVLPRCGCILLAKTCSGSLGLSVSVSVYFQLNLVAGYSETDESLHLMISHWMKSAAGQWNDDDATRRPRDPCPLDRQSENSTSRKCKFEIPQLHGQSLPLRGH